MSVFDEYRAKLRTADEAVKLVKSGDWVDYASMNGFPKILDAALARRRDELHHVKIRGNLIPGPVQVSATRALSILCTTHGSARPMKDT